MTGSPHSQMIPKQVTRIQLSENSPLPLSRTYHAACLIGHYMVISGGEANADMQDVWAFNLNTSSW